MKTAPQNMTHPRGLGVWGLGGFGFGFGSGLGLGLGLG
jgi:hypothetical protein